MSVAEALCDMTHDEARDWLAHCLRQQRLYVRTEVSLPNNCRADVLSKDHSERITIWEVKTWFRPALPPTAITRYAAFCHQLIMVFADPRERLHDVWQRAALDFTAPPVTGTATLTREGLLILRRAPDRVPRHPLFNSFAASLI